MEKTFTVAFTMDQLAAVAASLHACGQNAVMPMEPDDALAWLGETAGSWVTHWLEDEGMDAPERATAEQAERDLETAEKVVERTIEAARAMLAVLRDLKDSMAYSDQYGFADELRDINTAIAAAEAAGITAKTEG